MFGRLAPQISLRFVCVRHLTATRLMGSRNPHELPNKKKRGRKPELAATETLRKFFLFIIHECKLVRAYKGAFLSYIPAPASGAPNIHGGMKRAGRIFRLITLYLEKVSQLWRMYIHAELFVRGFSYLFSFFVALYVHMKQGQQRQAM